MDSIPDVAEIAAVNNDEMFEHVAQIYQASDAAATRQLYRNLESCGIDGKLAAALLRAQKSSERAKVYGRTSYRGRAYDRKEEAMSAVCALLNGTKYQWGWGSDDDQPMYRHVLYLDLPTGQVSFHAAVRGQGPDYPGSWDGIPRQSPSRICRWAAIILVADGFELE
jgi:hypothetical protein